MDKKTYEQLVENIKPKLTQEFLDTLEQAQMLFDLKEVAFFVEHMFNLAGKEPLKQKIKVQ